MGEKDDKFKGALLLVGVDLASGLKDGKDLLVENTWEINNGKHKLVKQEIYDMDNLDLLGIVKEVESEISDNRLKISILNNYARISTLEAMKIDLRRDFEIKINSINVWELNLKRDIRKAYDELKK